MSSLEELIHYCNEDDPKGALMLTGEWGCGKTYLIKKDLKKALKDTHIIIRISLFGMSSTKTLRDTIRRRWLDACLPFVGAIEKARQGGAARALSNMLYRFNPVAGGAAKVVVSANMQDFIPLKAEVEDLKTHQKKKVILVYDDLERAKMELDEVLGVVNDYCENHKFNSIISVNEESMRTRIEGDLTAYQMLREKTVSQILYHIPNYAEVIQTIINKTEWQSPEYKDYLIAREELIRQAFISDEEALDISSVIQKDRINHNFRTLTKGLQSFYRIYFDILESGRDVTDEHLYSFLSYYLMVNSGIMRDGKPSLRFEEKEISEFYPKYSTDALTNTERIWISTGLWDKEGFLKELADIGQ